MSAAVAAGIALGVLSRAEEVVPGFSAGISSDSAWVAVAFAAGAWAGGPRAAVVAMTVANAAYYGWVAVTEPGTPLASVAGDPWAWVALGLLTGAVFGAAGAVWAAAPPSSPRRLLGGLPLAAVLVAEGAAAVGGGHPAAGAGLLAGLAIPLASVRTLPRAAAVSTAALVIVGATGVATPLLP